MIKEEPEKIILEIGNKIYSIDPVEFSGDINVEELLQVDYNNIMGDIITFPVVFNRIANIKAEIDSLLREVEFDFDVYESQLTEEYRISLCREEINSRSTKMIWPTGDQIKNTIRQLKIYKVKMYEVIKVKKQTKIIDGLYWSAKMKGKMLETISNKIQPEEFEHKLIEGRINDVMIKTHKNWFKDGKNRS